MGGTALVSERDDVWLEGDTGGFVTLRSVASDGGQLVAAGDGGLLLRSADGFRWHEEPSPTIEELFAITHGSHGWVAVAGVDAILSSHDGRAWRSTAVGG
jgi:hypothetical protein